MEANAKSHHQTAKCPFFQLGRCRHQLFEKASTDLYELQQNTWAPLAKPLVVDSGAGETVTPVDWLTSHPLTESDGSRANDFKTTARKLNVCTFDKAASISNSIFSTQYLPDQQMVPLNFRALSSFCFSRPIAAFLFIELLLSFLTKSLAINDLLEFFVSFTPDYVYPSGGFFHFNCELRGNSTRYKMFSIVINVPFHTACFTLLTISSQSLSKFRFFVSLLCIICHSFVMMSCGRPISLSKASMYSSSTR